MLPPEICIGVCGCNYHKNYGCIISNGNSLILYIHFGGYNILTVIKTVIAIVTSLTTKTTVRVI